VAGSDTGKSSIREPTRDAEHAATKREVWHRRKRLRMKKAKKTIKAVPKKKTAQNALQKARSALKKTEHVNTPQSIKRKLASKKKEKKS
jgi:hypothetical protein